MGLSIFVLSSKRSTEPCSMNQEFIATDAADRIDFAQAGAQALRNFNERDVAGAVAERIVDVFEAIQINKQNS